VPTRSAELKPQTQSVALCRKILEECIPADANRLFYTAARRAFIRKFAQWYVSAPPQNCTINGGIGNEELVQIEKEWTQLAVLLFRTPPRIPNRDWRRLPTEAQIVRVLRHALRTVADHNAKGRPVSNLRRQALLALDLQRSDSKRWSWRALTNHFCNCGLREHAYNSKCQKNLRREALLVKKSLADLGVRLPTQRNNR
jgi:hypothetical protein